MEEDVAPLRENIILQLEIDLSHLTDQAVPPSVPTTLIHERFIYRHI